MSTRPPSPAVVLGFAETATGLGHLVADQLRAACYLHSTRRMVPSVEVAGTFEEGHSHATDHLLLPVPTTLLDTDAPLVLVDDELSTGKTAMGTITEAHRRHRRRHYVLASLIDLRSEADEAEMQLPGGASGLPHRRRLAGQRFGGAPRRFDRGGHESACRSSTVDRPRRSSAHQRSSRQTPTSVPVLPAVHRTDILWPADIPDGGRHGFLRSDRDRFEWELRRAAAITGTAVARRLAGNGRQVVVIGTEEFMYLPVRLAEILSADPTLRVRFQSTTRSPVLAIDDVGYPIRRQFRFADPEGDPDQSRFLYNCYAQSADVRTPAATRSLAGAAAPTDAVQATHAEADLIVVVVDADADTAHLHGPDGLPAQLILAGLAVELIVVGAVDTAQLAKGRTVSRTLPVPLRGPVVRLLFAGRGCLAGDRPVRRGPRR